MIDGVKHLMDYPLEGQFFHEAIENKLVSNLEPVEKKKQMVNEPSPLAMLLKNSPYLLAEREQNPLH